MTEKLETKIRIEGWDERPSREYDDGTKVAHAVVTLADGKDGLTDGHLESVLYYRADGTSRYVGTLRLEGTLGGRTGALTALGEGTFDGTTASSTMPIVDGSGGLAGITGSVSSSSTHADYPNMPLVIEYDLDG